MKLVLNGAGYCTRSGMVHRRQDLLQAELTGHSATGHGREKFPGGVEAPGSCLSHLSDCLLDDSLLYWIALTITCAEAMYLYCLLSNKQRIYAPGPTCTSFRKHWRKKKEEQADVFSYAWHERKWKPRFYCTDERRPCDCSSMSADKTFGRKMKTLRYIYDRAAKGSTRFWTAGVMVSRPVGDNWVLLDRPRWLYHRSVEWLYTKLLKKLC